MNAQLGVTSRIATILLVAGLLGALALGAAVGAQLGATASRAGAQDLSIGDSASERALAAEGLRSAGGFTGFGGPPALQGEVLRVGAVAEVAPGRLVLSEGAASVTLDYSEPRRLFRIRTAPEAPVPGDAAIVTLDGGVATGVLLIR